MSGLRDSVEAEESQAGLCALYCRVSTDEQAREGVSLDEQQERLCAYCRALGLREDLLVFIDDGYSAKNLDRPELVRLIAAVREGKISRVMVTKLDRMSRRLLDLLNLLDLFQNCGVSFVSVSESFDTNTPSGRLTLQVLGAVAEFERERIRERVFENMLHAAGTGKWLTQSPYGYDLIAKALVVNEHEARTVRRVFDLYLNEGRGFYAIAKMLNEAGIPSRRQKEWSIRSVKLLLTNPAYKGTLVWNRKDSGKARRKEKDRTEWVVVHDCLPAIIEKSVWEKTQAKIGQARLPPRAATSPHLLGGLLRCGNCGSGMSSGLSGSPQRRFRVYRCSAHKNKGTCTGKQYRADEVESWFKEGLARLARNVSGRLIVKAADAGAKSERERLEQQINTANARYKRKIEAYAAGLIELADLIEEKEKLAQIISERAKIARGAYETINLPAIERELNETVDSLTAAIDLLPAAQAKEMIVLVVQNVFIYGQADIEIALQPITAV